MVWPLSGVGRLDLLGPNVLPMAAAIPPAAGLLMLSLSCLNEPDSRSPSATGAGAGPFASLAREASMRAAASAAKLVSTIGAAPPAEMGAAFLALVPAFAVLVAADFVVVFALAALADLVVVFFGAALGLDSLAICDT